ncbi:hypothetical protein CSUI_008109 [Cystoisospora suis]|uniref:Transmembrane protein n=1 Tax=Cystoisospora suis TaxID=483139 RepID=A0A2C6KNL5_9APIC|nr:hypothetical protein CSUI_008109 [Cystoisospora suis]
MLRITVLCEGLPVPSRLGSMLGVAVFILYALLEFKLTDSLLIPRVRHSSYGSLQSVSGNHGEEGRPPFGYSGFLPPESSFTEVAVRSGGESDGDEEEPADSDEEASGDRGPEEKGHEKESREGKGDGQSGDEVDTEEAKSRDERAEESHSSEETEHGGKKEVEEAEEGGRGKKEHQSEHTKSAETKEEVEEETEREGKAKESKEETEEEKGGEKDEKEKREQEKHEKKSKGEKEDEPEHNELMTKLRNLIGGATGSEMLERLRTVITEHEKEEKRRAEEEETRKKAEAEKKKKEEEMHKEEEKKHEEEKLRKKQEEERKQAPAKDLLLTQQLTALWMLPFLHDKTTADTCLSGFEKLAQQSRITCSDPACLKLEQDPHTCAFLDVHSIDRPHGSNDHSTALHLGFDPHCKSASSLGTEILKMLQHPVKQYEVEQKLQSVGTGLSVPPVSNHLDLVCESSDSTKHPTCNAVTQALRNVPHLGPKNLPSMLVLTDIADIPNTVGLFRIAIVFEGRVPLLNTKGQLVDRTGAKLPDAAARHLFSNLHRLRQG